MLLLVHDSSTHEKINGSKDIVVSRSTTSISLPAHPGTFSWVKFASVEPCLQLIKVHQLNSACVHRRRPLAKLGKRAGNQCWRALAQGSASRGFQPRKHQRCPVPQRQSFAIGLDLGPYFLSIIIFSHNLSTKFAGLVSAVQLPPFCKLPLHVLVPEGTPFRLAIHAFSNWWPGPSIIIIYHHLL